MGGVRKAALLVAISACGRIGFDPLPTGDAPRQPVDGTKLADAAATACTTAIEVQANVPLTGLDTCTGQLGLPVCGPAGTRALVFRFVAPASAGYTIRAYDTGTMNISNLTGLADATCTSHTVCAGLYGTSYAANDVAYFVVGAAAGGCATIDFLVTQP